MCHPIEKFVNLKYIQLTSAGFDRVPMDYVKEHGIEIHNARGVYSVPMAEFAVAGVLELYKKIRFFHENQKKHNWEKHRGLLEFLSRGIGYILRGTGLPNEIIPLVIVKMFSSSAATGLCLDIFKNCGADSDTGFMASVIMSCTETIFYTMSVYYMAAKVAKTRWTLAGSLISSVAGVAASIFITMMR